MGLFRKPVDKASSAKKFRHSISRTKAANVPTKRAIMRGGQRM